MSIFERGDVINSYTIVKLLGHSPNRYSFLATKTLFDPSTGGEMVKSYSLKAMELSSPQVEQVLKTESQLLVEISSNPSSNKFIPITHEYFTHTIVENIENLPPRTIHYLVTATDFINGQSLHEIILEQESQPFSPYQIIQIMSQLSEAVDYIHSYGIAHQNIKPTNIILDSSDSRYKLVDLTSMCSKDVSSSCPSNVGTIYYTPPELLVQKPPTQFKYRLGHDMWSLGVTFFSIANLGQDYMNFTSHESQLLAKEIQLLPANKSRNTFAPINGIIDVLLEKDPAKRPNAPQLVVLVYKARPFCTVGGIEYDRVESQAILSSLDINIDINSDDYSLCSSLNAFMEKCNIKEKDYDRSSMVKIAKVMGINFDNDISSRELCKTITTGLNEKKKEFSSRVTNDLLKTLEFISALDVKEKSEKIQQIIKELQQDYIETFTEAKNLGLVDIKMLESRRKEATHTAIVYSQTVGEGYAKMYAQLANRITQVILNINPEANVNGIPLDAFQSKSLDPR